MLFGVTTKAVEAFKAFKKEVLQHAMTIYNNIIHSCHWILWELGCVPEDIVMHIESQVKCSSWVILLLRCSRELTIPYRQHGRYLWW